MIDSETVRLLQGLVKLAEAGEPTIVMSSFQGATYNKKRRRTTFRIEVEGNRVRWLLNDSGITMALVAADWSKLQEAMVQPESRPKP